MRERFRILHCLRAPVGGLLRHVCDLAAEQSRRGHAVGILCDSGTGGPRAAAILDALAPSPSLALGITRVAMGRQIDLRDITATLKARRLTRRLRVQILHGHGAKGGAYARLAAAMLRWRDRGMAPAAILWSRRSGQSLPRPPPPIRGPSSPLAFYTPHGGSLHYDPSSLQGRLFLGLERRLLRLTDGLLFESAYSAHRFTERVGPPACPVRVVPNGLGPADFTPHAPAPEAADFLFVGELRHLKGVDVLLTALARLGESGANATAIIVGDGPDRQTFERMAGTLGLEPLIRFAGAMPAPRAFPLGRCLVVPSRAESFPYIVLEGAAAGIPMILTDVGGIPEITAGTPCPLLPPGDTAALADHMQIFLSDPDALRTQTRVLRDRVAGAFTIARMTDDILDLYTAALSAQSTTPKAPPRRRIPARPPSARKPPLGFSKRFPSSPRG